MVALREGVGGVVIGPALAAVTWTLAVLVAPWLSACAVDLPPRPVDAPGRVLLDCGALAPNLFVSCNDGQPPQVLQELLSTSRSLHLGEDAQDSIGIPCALALDAGRVVTAGYRAVCGRPEGTVAQLVLEGHAERRCGYGAQGSSAEVRPVWRAFLEAPADASAALRVVAERTPGADDACAIRVGDEEVRPRFGGPASWSGALAAGERRSLTIDCSGEPARSGLAVAGCFGFTEGSAFSPPVSYERVIVTVTAP